MNCSFRYLGFIVIVLLCPSVSEATDSPITSFVENFLSVQDIEKHRSLMKDLMHNNNIKSFDSLLIEADILEKLFEENKDLRYQSFAHALRGDAYYLTGAYDTAAIHLLSQAECLLGAEINSSNNNLISSGYQGSAACLNLIGEKQKAILYAREALKHARMAELTLREADAHFVLASANYGLLQLDSALVHLTRCYELDLILEDTYGLISVQYMIGNLYSDQNKNDEALDMYHKVLSEIPDTTIYERFKISGYSYISEIHSKEGDIDSALYYLNLALAVPEATKASNINSKLKIELAFLYLDADDIESAYKTYQEIAAENIVNDKSSLGFKYLRLCTLVNLKKGLLQAAEACLLLALPNLEENDLQTRKRSLYPLAVQLYEKKNNPTKALWYSKQLTALVEKINSDELEKEILKTKYEFEADNLQNEKEIVELENSLLDEKLNRRNSLALYLIGFLLLSLISLYLFFKQTKAKEKLRMEVQKAVVEKKERQILEKDMQALRSQMNPHFMFNSLSSINHYIMNEEPRKASRFLTKFASLMRNILSNSKKRYVPLAEELKALNLYSEIENLRFENKFDFKMEIDDEVNLESFLIPPMILQPYIENAIKHAFVDVKYKPEIKLTIKKTEIGIQINIEDNGIGRKLSGTKKKVLANQDRPHSMDITQSRLALISKLYDVDSSLHIEDRLDSDGNVCGTRITINMPKINETTIFE